MLQLQFHRDIGIDMAYLLSSRVAGTLALALLLAAQQECEGRGRREDDDWAAGVMGLTTMSRQMGLEANCWVCLVG